MLKVTKISDQTLLKTCKIAKKNVSVSSNQLLEMAWSQSGDQLFVAGDSQLTLFDRSDNFASQHILASISHVKEISLVKVISPTCLVTAGLDKWIKVWSVAEGCLSSISKAKLVAQFKVE